MYTNTLLKFFLYILQGILYDIFEECIGCYQITVLSSIEEWIYQRMNHLSFKESYWFLYFGVELFKSLWNPGNEIDKLNHVTKFPL